MIFQEALIWGLERWERGFPAGSVVENPPANAGATGDRFDLRVGKIPWKRKWQPTPVFLPG